MRAAQASASSAPSGAAPEYTNSSDDRSNRSTSGCLASASTTGGATKSCRTRCASISRSAASSSKRGSVTCTPPIAR